MPFLTATILKYVSGALGLALLVALAWGMRVSDLRARWHHQYESEHSARIADRASYGQAQKDAAAQNRAHVAAIEQQQKEITDETVSNLNARLERLRRELRGQGIAAPQGSPGRAGSPEDGNTATGADGEARVCVPASVILHGAENEERHDRLIDWVERQSKVNPN